MYVCKTMTAGQSKVCTIYVNLQPPCIILSGIYVTCTMKYQVHDLCTFVWCMHQVRINIIITDCTKLLMYILEVRADEIVVAIGHTMK